MLGHRLVATYPMPSGWRARCACNHTSRGPDELAAIDAHELHMDTVR